MWVILGREREQHDALIRTGKFRSGPFYRDAALPITGRQHLKFTAYFNGAWQNARVLSLVGEGGTNLRGKLFKLTDPDVIDSDKILDSRFTLSMPPITPQVKAVVIVKHAHLSIPGVGQSATSVEENIRMFTVPGTGVRPAKGWSAMPAGQSLYRVAYDFIDGAAGEKQATWSVDIVTKRVSR